MRLNPTVVPVFVFAIVLFRTGSVLEKKTVSRAGRVCLFGASILLSLPSFLFALYYTHLFDSAVWFYSFRTWPYTELVIAGCGLLGEVLNSWFGPETLGERAIVPAALSVLLMIPFVKPLLDPIDLEQLSERCEGEVCMQSTHSTCGPSSSATILKLFGQTASERGLARECLTSRGGTKIWYIARAIKRRGLRASVQIQSLDHLSPPSPAIAGVVLPGGAGHFIAIINTTPDTVTIGDPMKGKLVVKRDDLSSVYHFTGFFLAINAR
jgi:predicted double-glycine peptidase